MIFLKLGILLCVPLNSDLSKENKAKNKRKNAKAAQKKPKKPKKENLVTEKPPKPRYVFDGGNPKGFLQIQYKLLQNSEPHIIDILHWNEISKIFYEGETVLYKNVIRDNVVWIPVMLEHRFDDLKLNELEELKNHIVVFEISANKKKMSKKAKENKSQEFFVKDSDVESQNFAEAFEEDPNVPTFKLAVKKSALNVKTLNGNQNTENNVHFSESKTIVTKLQQFEIKCIYAKMLKILKKLQNNEDISSKEFIPLALEPLEQREEELDEDDPIFYKWPKASKGKKPKKEKKKAKTKKPKKEKKKNDVTIKVSGESFFTDHFMCTYQLSEKSEHVENAFVIFSIDNLMSYVDLEELSPLVIKLKSIRNLPVEFLLEQGINSVYLQYNIPEIARHEGIHKILKTPKKKLRFNESHVFFNLPMSTLGEFLYSQRLRVELVGVYQNEEEEIQASLFGAQKSDYENQQINVHKFIHKRPKTIILAVACFDLSMLLKSVHDLQLFGNFRHPNHQMVRDSNDMYKNAVFKRPFTINEVNFLYKQQRFQSPLDDNILLERNVFLKIQVIAEKPLCGLSEVTMNPLNYMRIFLIFYHMDFAKIIINDVYLYNRYYMPESLFRNFFMYNKRTNEEFRKQIDPEEKMITGFCIDNSTSFIVFLEGTNINWCMHNIYNEVKILNETVCKCYFNSDLSYSKRIYKNFVAFGGIFWAALKYPLQTIFANQKVYLRNNVPVPAGEALKKFEHIFLIPFSNQIYQYGAMPTENELFSFALEFGVTPRIVNFGELEN